MYVHCTVDGMHTTYMWYNTYMYSIYMCVIKYCSATRQTTASGCLLRRAKVRTALFSILYLFYIKNTSYLQYSYRLKKSLNVLKQWSVPGMLYYIY